MIFPQGIILYHLLYPGDRAALEWLRNQDNLRGQYVLSSGFFGTVITPLTGFPAPINWLTLQGPDAQNHPEWFSFFDIKDCTEKAAITRELGTWVIYGNVPQQCSFLKEVYNRNGIFIYHSVL